MWIIHNLTEFAQRDIPSQLSEFSPSACVPPHRAEEREQYEDQKNENGPWGYDEQLGSPDMVISVSHIKRRAPNTEAYVGRQNERLLCTREQLRSVRGHDVRPGLDPSEQ